MSESKTIREWLETLPPGYRERALRCKERRWSWKEEVSSMTNALTNFTLWDSTVEGSHFWSAVTDHYHYTHKKYPLPPLPDDGGPGSKPKRDARLVAVITDSKFDFDGTPYSWQLRDGSHMVADGRYYTTRYAAKRGLIRFLARLDLDKDAVRWEAESGR